MSFLPQARVIVVTPFARTLLTMGVRVEPLLRRAGLPLPWRCDGNALVPSTALFEFLADAARLTGASDFGLRAGSQMQPEDLGWYGRLLLHSHTGAEMVIRAQWLIRGLHSGHLIWTEPAGDQVRVCATFASCLRRGRREAEQFAFLSTLNTIRMIAPDWRPREVQLQCEPEAQLRQYEVLSDARLVFRQPVTSIAIPRTVLRRPVPAARRDDPRYVAMLQQKFLATAPILRDLSEVRRTVAAFLSEGPPTIEQTAAALAVSTRTLQRRLLADALTYSRLLEQVRFERARELLADRHLRTVDVAFELGYTDQSNFSRAFRRWVGMSPGAYRHALLHDQEAAASLAVAAATPHAATVAS